MPIRTSDKEIEHIIRRVMCDVRHIWFLRPRNSNNTWDENRDVDLEPSQWGRGKTFSRGPSGQDKIL